MKIFQRLLRACSGLVAGAALLAGLTVPAQAMTAAPKSVSHADTARSAGNYWSGTARSAGKCKVWLNRSGKKFQMVGQSWGHYCTISFARYHNGSVLRDPKNFGSGTVASGWYWDGPGYKVYIAVYDNDARQGNSGGPFTL